MHISGNSANDRLFQAYLLEGISRWNEDRAMTASTACANPTIQPKAPSSYSGKLKEAINTLSRKVLNGAELVPGYVAPMKYTGNDSF